MLMLPAAVFRAGSGVKRKGSGGWQRAAVPEKGRGSAGLLQVRCNGAKTGTGDRAGGGSRVCGRPGVRPGDAGGAITPGRPGRSGYIKPHNIHSRSRADVTAPGSDGGGDVRAGETRAGGGSKVCGRPSAESGRAAPGLRPRRDRAVTAGHDGRGGQSCAGAFKGKNLQEW